MLGSVILSERRIRASPHETRTLRVDVAPSARGLGRQGLALG